VPAGVRGIDGTAVRVLVCDDLGALVSTRDRATVEPTIDAVRAHDAAVQAAVDAGVTVAASRFRQSFADDAEACQHVMTHGARIAAMLEERDGCVEMRVLVQDSQRFPSVSAEPAGDVPRGGPGLAYLQQLRDKGESMRRLSVRNALGPDAGVRAERITPIRDDAAAFAHLVHRDDLAAYRAAFSRVPALADATVVGPLALYTFAEPDR